MKDRNEIKEMIDTLIEKDSSPYNTELERRIIIEKSKILTWVLEDEE